MLKALVHALRWGRHGPMPPGQGSGALGHRTRRTLAGMNVDALILAADSALRTLLAEPRASRPTPRPDAPGEPLDDAQRRASAALMRVNHVGEVCAQALYTGQMLASRNPVLRAQLGDSADDVCPIAGLHQVQLYVLQLCAPSQHGRQP